MISNRISHLGSAVRASGDPDRGGMGVAAEPHRVPVGPPLGPRSACSTPESHSHTSCGRAGSGAAHCGKGWKGLAVDTTSL